MTDNNWIELNFININIDININVNLQFEKCKSRDFKIDYLRRREGTRQIEGGMHDQI